MKKKILIGAALAIALAAAGILAWNVIGSMGSSNMTDVSWYDPDKESFSISTEQELYDLAKLSEYYDFVGQTIQLEADIVVNEGNAEEWGERAPEKTWYPITGFAGTFDGQGHTISGLYGCGYYSPMGLFADTQKTSKIRNLKLINSFFSAVGSEGVGSISGRGGGIFDTIYSNAFIRGGESCYGGIVGILDVRGNNVISNCWYDGSMTLSGSAAQAGGIAGYINCLGAANSIEHCLNTASITCWNTMIGGICGGVADGSNIDIEDSLNTGTMECRVATWGIGSVIGQIGGSSSSTKLVNAYAAYESYVYAVGRFMGSVAGNVKKVEAAKLNGYRAYQWTELDFENYWTVVLESTPILQAFADEVVDVSAVNKIIDTSWYDEDERVYTLTTAGQLYGLADLLSEVSFQGKTIRLGADIVINEGDARTWATEAPEYKWFPLGRSGVNETYSRFAGTFDGDGHTISGLYTKEALTTLGFFGSISGTVKNLILENSYFEYTGTAAYSYVGSIAGANFGEINTIKSSAIVVNCANATGGIAGYTEGCTITNCWFDGTIISNGEGANQYGGMLGLLNAGEGKVEHCLNTGTIVTKGSAVGGLVGSIINGGVLTINDSLCTGTCDNQANALATGNAFGWCGLGPVKADGTRDGGVYLNNVYGIREFSKNLYGGITKGGAEPLGVMTNAKLISGFDGYKYTTLDFVNYWAVNKSGTPILRSFAASVPDVSGIARMMDYSWYNKDQKEFTLTTAAQLYGFSALSQRYITFEDQTVKLGADIDLNPGWTAGATAPAQVWHTMIGNAAAPFAGTFDGQGHTIRGLYRSDPDKDLIGLFERVAATGTVKNLKLANSYIAGHDAVGSIVAACQGTLQNVYSSATVIGHQVVGGIVGNCNGGAATYSGLWFDGTVTGQESNSYYLGGLVGYQAATAILTIEDSLNGGSVIQLDSVSAAPSPATGGIIGYTDNMDKLTLRHVLNTGTVSIGSDSGKYNAGSIVGFSHWKSGTITLDGHSYAVTETSYGTNMGTARFGLNTCVVSDIQNQSNVTFDSVTGTAAASALIGFDFESAWALLDGKYPVPAAFANGVTPVMSWQAPKSTGGSDTLLISTAEEFLAFAAASQSDDFAGKTIKLGADIDLNPGWTAGATAPDTVWTPACPGGYAFAGTFDGQGHTISGVYYNDPEADLIGLFGRVAATGTVKNLKLANSYIAGHDAVASLVGVCQGTLQNVYSSATVIGRQVVGGIVANCNGGAATYSGLWFEGTVTGTDCYIGGIVGYQSSSATLRIEESLNGGTVTQTDAASWPHTGGIIGYADSLNKLTLSHVLNAGRVSIAGSGAAQKNRAASLVGNGRSGAAVLDGHSYALNPESYGTNLQGNTIGLNFGFNTPSNAANVTLASVTGVGAATTLVDFDFESDWALRVGTYPVPVAFVEGLA